MNGSGFNNSLEKGLQLMLLFASGGGPSTLGEISRGSGMPKATTLRFLTAFARNGFLRRDEAGKYSLGLRLIELGHLAAEQFDLRTVALPYMAALRDELDEAVQIAVIDGLEAVYVEKVECRQPVRLFTRAGRRAPLNAGACPRLLLAYADPALVEAVLQNPGGLKRFTDATPTVPDQLRQLLAQTRKDGFSLSYGEMEPGSASLAVPIRDYSGKVIATLSVAGPETRFSPERIPAIRAAALRAAQAISTILGATDQ
jgi:IclR family KDG regulon transcriptional repressor